MAVEVGAKVSGKVTGITNFGAFVDLGAGKSGLVHISEISDGYVKDIHDVLSVGDTVTAVVMQIKDGKVAYRSAALMARNTLNMVTIKAAMPMVQPITIATIKRHVLKIMALPIRHVRKTSMPNNKSLL